MGKKNLNPKFWTEVDKEFRCWIEFSFGCQKEGQWDIVALFGLHKLILLGLYIYIYIVGCQISWYWYLFLGFVDVQGNYLGESLSWTWKW